MTISKCCRIALFDQMIVALDLKRSRYFLYGEACATAFAKCYLDTREADRSAALEPLISDGIILRKSSRLFCGRQWISDHRGMRFQTFDTGAWESRTLGKRELSEFRVRPLFEIIKSALLLKIFGFGALSALERLWLHSTSTVGPSAADPTAMIEQHLSASMWSPFRITCLPFSFSLATHLRQNNIPAQLVIRVRPLPFVAHAWVEIDGNVCGDDPDLKRSYGEIYRTPRHDGIH